MIKGFEAMREELTTALEELKKSMVQDFITSMLEGRR